MEPYLLFKASTEMLAWAGLGKLLRRQAIYGLWHKKLYRYNQVIRTSLVHSLPADGQLTPRQGGHKSHLHVRGWVIAAPMVMNGSLALVSFKLELTGVLHTLASCMLNCLSMFSE